MSRLVMWNLMTLDGCFEGPTQWDLSFHEYVWGPELEQLSLEQLRTAGALLFGRVTYEGMAAYWRTETGAIAELMNSIPKIVFSRTLAQADWNNTRLYRGSAPEEVARLKREAGRDLYVFGSAVLCASLMEHDLFDEYRLCVVPVVRGAGTPLFKLAAAGKAMTIRETRPLEMGGAILYCEPRAE